MDFWIFLLAIVMGCLSGYAQHGAYSSRIMILAGTASLSSTMMFLSEAMAQGLYVAALALFAVFVLSHLLGYVFFWAVIVRKQKTSDDP